MSFERNSEIDAIELFQQIWRQKFFIIAISAAVSMAAAAYAFLSMPIYEARATVLPPQISDIAALNEARSAAKLNVYKPGDIYNIYKSYLQSEKVKREIFESLYLPSMDGTKGERGGERLWNHFRKLVSVQSPDQKNRPELFEITFQHEEPSTAADWLAQYLASASENTRTELQKDLQAEISIRVKSLEQEIALLKSVTQKEREDRIVRLREALTVAESLGIDAPQRASGKDSSGELVDIFTDGAMAYLRGAKSIRAELVVLESRKDDAPFVTGLRDLERQLVLLKEVKVSPDQVVVYSPDANVEVPENPVKPRRLLIVSLGLVLGAMVGVFLALIRILVMRNR